MATPYEKFVFDEIRRIGRAWRSQNPHEFPQGLSEEDAVHLFEKIGDMSWRRLADKKPMRQIMEEIGVNPGDFLDPEPVPTFSRPIGGVQLINRAVHDARGPWNALGASLFWGGWGYLNDRERLDRNLAWLKNAGVDYVRVLGTIGGPSWEDRAFEPNQPDWLEAIVGLTDHVYDNFGMRTQWTIFGGSPATSSPTVRERVVDDFANMSMHRNEKLFAFEIANEGWGSHHDATLGEQRNLANRLRSKVSILVTVTAPNETVDAVCKTFADAADIASMHYERNFGADGPWRPIRQPWGYPGEYEANCKGKLPEGVLNNEPIGPQSSVNEENDPLRLVCGYVTTFIAKNAAYVFHAGPGIRGGGAADQAKGRSANFDELPHAAEYAQMFHTARSYMPEGLATWQRHNAQWGTAPFVGFDTAVENRHIIRCFCATHDAEIFGIVLGIRQPVEVKARRAMLISQLHPLTGEVVKGPLEITANGTMSVGASVPAIVLKGIHR